MPLFEQQNIFGGEQGQVYRDMVNAHENSLGAERAIILLFNAGLLNGEGARENCITVMSHPCPDYVADTLATLQESGLLDGERAREYRELVLAHPKILQFADGLVALDEAGLLNGDRREEYLRLISEHPNPNQAGLAIQVLEFAGLLDVALGREHCQKVLASFDPFISAHALVVLLDLNLLNLVQGRENRDAALFHQRPLDFARALGRLNSCGLLTGEDGWEFREALNAYINPYEIAEVMIVLHLVGLLNGDIGRQHRQEIIAHQNIGSLSYSIIYFHYMGLFEGEQALDNLSFLLHSPNPHFITNAFMSLEKSNLLRHELGQQNRQTLLAHPRLDVISYALIKLQFSGLLDQRRFNQLIEFSEILCQEPFGELWYFIPPQFFRAEHFDGMIMRCQNLAHSIERRQENVLRYLRRIMIAHSPQVAVEINDDQSTHRASVHASVSESARNLMVRYGAQLVSESDCFRLTRVLGARIGALETCLVHDAALRFLERYDEELFDYIDPVSEVSTRQLLALCTLAIDDEVRLQEKEVSRMDAFRALVHGLYEVQRGYNINQENIDNGHADAPICTVGTFNKLVSALWGLHPDCTITVITKETANAKLLPVILEKAMDFLKHVQQTRSRDDFAALLREITSDQLTPIWENIKGAIYASMEEEFGGLLTRPEMDAAQDCVELDLSSFSEVLPAQASAAASGMFSTSRPPTHEREDRTSEEFESPSLRNAGGI